MKVIEINNLKSDSRNELKISYAAKGFLVKGHYRKYSDSPAVYIAGYDLFYYGTHVTTYPCDEYATKAEHKKAMREILKGLV